MNIETQLRAWHDDVVETYTGRTPGSASLFERGRKHLPGGDTRFSLTYRPHPVYVARGEGPYIWDVDGHQLLDLNNNSTSLIHGHAHPDIVEAIRAQAGRGTAWGAHNENQVEWARILGERIPSVGRIRFSNSGTEANMHMVQVARAATGKNVILKLQGAYHGTFDGLEFVRPTQQGASGATPSMGGVPSNLSENIMLGDWGDTDGICRIVEDNADRMAAIILTPFRSAGGFAPPPPSFLEALRDVTSVHGVLLLFDEVISLRLGMGGAQKRYGVVPDMTAVGKLIGGGLAVGAFGGRADIMALTDPLGDMKVALAGTFNGNPLTGAAGLAALNLLNEGSFEHLDRLGAEFRSGLAKIIDDLGLPLLVQGGASLTTLAFDASAAEGWAGVADLAMAGLSLAFANHGLWGFPYFALSTVMEDEHVALALNRAAAGLEGLANAISSAERKAPAEGVRSA